MRMLATISLSLAVLIVSATAWAKQVHAARHHPAYVAKATAARADRRRLQDEHETSPLPAPDRVIGSVRVVGPREVGVAAWYGGSLIGMRTASGERLDATHQTAAHRSLPLHTLVRVTNLRNGRSAIVTINDRGPVSHSLLIDLSPRVADELDMRRSGIAQVAVEPVAEMTTVSR